MPIFEYECVKCGCRFEKLQKDGSTGVPDCPTCGSEDVKKELSTFAATGGASPAAGCKSTSSG